MKLSISKYRDVPVLHLQGRLSVIGADEFERQVLTAIDGGGKRLLFVMDQLDYISSAGLRIFYLAIKKLDNDGARLLFCGMQPAVRTIFDIIGLSPSVKIFANEAEARADLDSTLAS